MSVSCECCVLVGRSLCEGLITRPEESCSECVCVCVPLSVIRCNSKPLYLQWLGNKSQTMQVRKKGSRSFNFR